MREARIRLATVAVVIFVGRALSGCGAPTPARRFHPEVDGSGGPAEADSGADTGGSGPGTGGAAATGGGGGEPGGTGGSAATGGTPGQPPDASVESTGGAAGGGDTGGSGTGGAVATGGTSGTPDAGSAGPEAGHAVPGSGGTAACFTDPNVIAICKQLEPACLNCADQSILDECFGVAAASDDEDCARYAVDNDCTVDVGGNTCGSLNCRAAGCDRTACTDAQGEGNDTACRAMLATCPCE